MYNNKNFVKRGKSKTYTQTETHEKSGVKGPIQKTKPEGVWKPRNVIATTSQVNKESIPVSVISPNVMELDFMSKFGMKQSTSEVRDENPINPNFPKVEGFVNSGTHETKRDVTLNHTSTTTDKIYEARMMEPKVIRDGTKKQIETEIQLNEEADAYPKFQNGQRRVEKRDKIETLTKPVKLSLAQFYSSIGWNAEDDEENETPSRILWVGNIGPQVTEEELQQEFGQFGKIESLRILHNRYCAFINFEEEKSAKEAKASLQGTIIGSQYIVINYRKASLSNTQNPLLTDIPTVNPQIIASAENTFTLNNPSRALWIGNIGETVTEFDLQTEFSKFGEIESIRLLRHKTCAFVNFNTAEEASLALQQLQGKLIGSKPIKINFGKPQSPKNPYEFSPEFVPNYVGQWPYVPDFGYVAEPNSVPMYVQPPLATYHGIDPYQMYVPIVYNPVEMNGTFYSDMAPGFIPFDQTHS